AGKKPITKNPISNERKTAQPAIEIPKRDFDAEDVESRQPPLPGAFFRKGNGRLSGSGAFVQDEVAFQELTREAFQFFQRNALGSMCRFVGLADFLQAIRAIHHAENPPLTFIEMEIA